MLNTRSSRIHKVNIYDSVDLFIPPQNHPNQTKVFTIQPEVKSTLYKVFNIPCLRLIQR